MSTNPPKRFDHLWHDFQTAYAQAGRHLRLLGMHLKEFRRYTYRMALYILEMQKHHHNELLAMIQSEGKSPTEWMDEKFAVVEQTNETRERLFAAIEAGVTEREYVEEAQIVIARKIIKAARTVTRDDGVIVRPSGKATTDAERAAELEDCWKSMVSKYQGVRHELRVTRKELAHAQVRIRKLEATIRRLKNDIDRLYSDQSTATRT